MQRLDNPRPLYYTGKAEETGQSTVTPEHGAGGFKGKQVRGLCEPVAVKREQPSREQSVCHWGNLGRPEDCRDL